MRGEAARMRWREDTVTDTRWGADTHGDSLLRGTRCRGRVGGGMGHGAVRCKWASNRRRRLVMMLAW